MFLPSVISALFISNLQVIIIDAAKLLLRTSVLISQGFSIPADNGKSNKTNAGLSFSGSAAVQESCRRGK